MSKSYPFSAWVLTRDFEPKKIELVKASRYSEHHETSTGKLYPNPQLYVSKKAAVEAGWRRLDVQQRAFEKSAASIAKRKQALSGHSKDL